MPHRRQDQSRARRRPGAADGKHEVATVLQRVDLGDRVAVEPATTLTVTGFAGDTLVRERSKRSPQPRESAALARDDREADSVAAGLGGGSSDAATALRLANETLANPLPPDELHELAAKLGADVPFFLADGPQLGRGRRRQSSKRSTSRRTTGSSSRSRSARRRSRRPTSTAVSTTAPAPTAGRRAARRCSARSPPSSGRATSQRSRRTTSRHPRSPRSSSGSAPSAPMSAGPARPSTGSSFTGVTPGPRDAPSEAPPAPGSRFRSGTGSRYGCPMDRPLTIEHGSTPMRPGLRENRLRIALLVAIVEGVLVLVGKIDWWVVAVLAIVAVALYVYRGRAARREEIREANVDPRGLAARRRPRAGARARPDGVRGRRARGLRDRRARHPPARPTRRICV